jgi:RNA polymerase sigma factor (sigma-70 family)
MEDPRLENSARRAVQGDRLAAEEVLRILRPALVRTARLIVGAGSGAAEEAAQEALLDVARGLPAVRDATRVRSWAIRITVRRALRTARRERIRALVWSPQLATPLAPDASRMTSRLKEAFDALPPKTRAVAVLRLYVGLSEQETAQMLGCSLGTAKSQLYEARRRLARTLQAEGMAPSTLHDGVPRGVEG